jgi:hypothetical protein
MYSDQITIKKPDLLATWNHWQRVVLFESNHYTGCPGIPTAIRLTPTEDKPV